MTKVQGMTIACPDDWLDKSMLMLTAARPGPTGVSPSFVVTREALPDDPRPGSSSRLDAFVDRQAEEMRHTLPGPMHIARRQASDPGASPELKVDWVSGGIPITQWITYAETGPDTIMIATGTAAREDFDTVEPTFHALLRSFRIT